MTSLITSTLFAILIPLFIYSGFSNQFLQNFPVNLNNDFIAGMLYCAAILLPILFFASRDFWKNYRHQSKVVSSLSNAITEKDREIQSLNSKINDLNFVAQNAADNILRQSQYEANAENKALHDRLNNAILTYKDQNRKIKEQENIIKNLKENLKTKESTIAYQRKIKSITERYLKSVKYKDGHSVFDDVKKQTIIIMKANPTPKKPHAEFVPSAPIYGKRAERYKQNMITRSTNTINSDNTF